MSASEKLKGLVDEFPHDMGDFDFRVQPLRAALPQIVAVVEAAEFFWAPGNLRATENLDAALIALEEALTTGSSPTPPEGATAP